MDTIHISNLRLRTIIGIHDWERKAEQDVIINLWIDYDGQKAAESDDIKDALDYKTVTKEIINEVQGSQYYLIEKLADKILNLALKDQKTEKATVRIDKPHALRFADSVSVEMSRERS